MPRNKRLNNRSHTVSHYQHHSHYDATSTATATINNTHQFIYKLFSFVTFSPNSSCSVVWLYVSISSNEFIIQFTLSFKNIQRSMYIWVALILNKLFSILINQDWLPLPLKYPFSSTTPK